MFDLDEFDSTFMMSVSYDIIKGMVVHRDITSSGYVITQFTNEMYLEYSRYYLEYSRYYLEYSRCFLEH